MATIVRHRRDPKLRDGVYRAIIADVEPGVASRFSPREDLIRISLDLVDEVDGQRPRLWLVAAPLLHGRLQALVEAALHRPLTEDEDEAFDIEEVIGKEVNVVVAQATSAGGFTSLRIVTFLPLPGTMPEHDTD
jgi:hypothetical protein